MNSLRILIVFGGVGGGTSKTEPQANRYIIVYEERIRVFILHGNESCVKSWREILDTKSWMRELKKPYISTKRMAIFFLV